MKSGEFQGFLLAIEAVAYTGKVVLVTGLREIISHPVGVLMPNQPGGFLGGRIMDHKRLETLRLRVVAAGALADDAADVADQAEAEHEAASLRYRRALDTMAKIRAKRKESAIEQPTTDHD